ncbi:glycosyltransferase involved in cell wall biosynthesis [Curtobacterium herbarum]|uniref:glycosyltransferase family 4 protein n=1 Tax=Curtobacterium herbarum TaxID=150122 RepID=UPI0020A1BBF4|nr:glycosyltransferase family 4 protein [Curtobacterium herbarum]MCP1504244.1 glycosyltransferase involved in cell wall biosynthesis [Curtobacterium herbarum]
MARIVIVQPYVPAYRRPFFVELARCLADDGHELTVASGLPDGEAGRRQDSVTLDGVHHETVPIQRLRFSNRVLRLGPSQSTWSHADAVIVELAAGSVPTYRALLGDIPVGVWGHVDSFVSRDSFLTRRLRGWQVRKADHVMAYTERGAATARRYGAHADQVTSLSNTVDTRPLREELLAARSRSDQSVRRDLGVPDGPLFCVIGGLDGSKRVDLLETLLDLLWESGSPVKLLVGGRGTEESRLERARERGQVFLFGHVDDPMKAKMARVSLGLLNPGRVGLIAVESLALGLPIITTKSDLHAPEFDYIHPGEDSIVVRPSADALKEALTALLHDPDRLVALAQAAEARADEYPMEHMVVQMRRAIDALLQRSR